MSIDAAAFKKGMRHLAASVTLITTRHRELRGGLTATAVCSVSAEPPQILVCVNKTASAHDPIGEAGFFCVNILSPAHRRIAERFAGMDDVEGDKRFHDMGEWSMLSTSAPVLRGSVSFDCRLVTKVAAGTHDLYRRDRRPCVAAMPARRRCSMPTAPSSCRRSRRRLRRREAAVAPFRQKSLWSGRLMGRRQVVRQWILIPPFPGSDPGAHSQAL